MSSPGEAALAAHEVAAAMKYIARWSEILANPQAHIDALVEAGVLERADMDWTRHYYKVVQPHHRHAWRVSLNFSHHDRLAVRCDCGATRHIPNTLPIEAPE